MRSTTQGVIAVVAFLLVITAVSTVYVVDVREQVVVTRFGKAVRVVAEPGLYFRYPWVEKLFVFDKRILEWDGEPADILTRDKENITVNTWARWRILDPLTFYTSLRTETGGQGVLDEVIESSVKNAVSSYPLMEVLRDEQRELDYTSEELKEAERGKGVRVQMGRSKLMAEVLAAASLGLRERYGIEILDVRIQYINYVPSVIPKIYERMRSERDRIANRYESEGRRKEAEILGRMQRELAEIESEGYQEATGIRGDGDATAVRIYAEAYGKDPEFYSFWKTLETYKTTLGPQTHLVIESDAEFLRYLESFGVDATEEGEGKPR